MANSNSVSAQSTSIYSGSTTGAQQAATRNTPSPTLEDSTVEDRKKKVTCCING
jgi:hypothetical protein